MPAPKSNDVMLTSFVHLLVRPQLFLRLFCSSSFFFVLFLVYPLYCLSFFFLFPVRPLWLFLVNLLLFHPVRSRVCLVSSLSRLVAPVKDVSTDEPLAETASRGDASMHSPRHFPHPSRIAKENQ